MYKITYTLTILDQGTPIKTSLVANIGASRKVLVCMHNLAAKCLHQYFLYMYIDRHDSFSNMVTSSFDSVKYVFTQLQLHSYVAICSDILYIIIVPIYIIFFHKLHNNVFIINRSR